MQGKDKNRLKFLILASFLEECDAGYLPFQQTILEENVFVTLRKPKGDT